MPQLASGGDDRKKKYHHPEYDDEVIENLAKYFRIDGYPSLLPFLKKISDD